MFTVDRNAIGRDGVGRNDHESQVIQEVKKTLKSAVFGCLAVMCLISVVLGGQVIYVDDGATGVNDGSTWPDAYRFLQDALSAADSDDQIWVAAGVYHPDQDSAHPEGIGDRDATFQLENGVTIYGGFPAGGGQWEDRDPSSHETVLSGDLSGNDGPDFANNDENSYHIATGSGTDATAILDGFTITAGNANHSYNNSPPYDLGVHWGAGMVNSFGSPTLANCTFIDNASNHGAGMANYSSSPTLADCVFENNTASITSTVQGHGGAMYNMENSHPTLTNCYFTRNSALLRGGAIRNNFSNSTFIDCVFDDNSAKFGGAVNSVDSNPTFENCSFTNNEAQEGGGAMVNIRSVPILTGCIFDNNFASIYGGAMFNKDSSSPPILSVCTFSRNRAGEQGGGMYNNKSGPVLTDCVFALNAAGKTSDGGAIHNRRGSSMTATRCRFIANTALRGAGVFIYQSGPTLIRHSNKT